MFSQLFQKDPEDHSTEVDQRESERRSCTGPIWWTSERGGKLKMVGVTNRTETSIAFRVRGELHLAPGDPVWLLDRLPKDDARDIRKEARVARVQLLHSDLFLVAVVLSPATQSP